jgi:hypothetical protein
LVAVSSYLIGGLEVDKMPLQPKAEYQWWYQYYFSTECGARYASVADAPESMLLKQRILLTDIVAAVGCER